MANIGTKIVTKTERLEKGTHGVHMVKPTVLGRKSKFEPSWTEPKSKQQSVFSEDEMLA